MTQFPRRNTQPMRADSYRRIARLLRGIADRIEACAERADPTEKRVITQLLHSLSRDARRWSDRHQATITGTLRVPPR